MRRVILFDRYDAPIGELSPDEVTSLVRTEEINGAHTLEITTERVLQQGWRIVTQDGTGKWREHVVYGTDALHASGDAVVGTYYCVWSVMHDLAGTTVSAMPGVQTPVLASVALDAALGGTSRWVRGTVTNTATGGASMYDRSGWEAIAVLLDVWGGELDVTIEVGPSGVTARKVDLYTMQGNDDALRRYDFGADLKSVRRKVEDGPLYCRISPRGKGEEVGDGYGRKITIEDVNGGKDYLVYQPMVDAAKLPNGSGGWEYPTLIVENSDCETPADLKAWGESVKERYCTPNVTYDVDVVQAAVEGIDMQGVSLGDVVHIVDRKFGDGIRLAGRVSSMTVDMLDERNARVIIGSVSEWLADSLKAMKAGFDSVHKSIMAVLAEQQFMATAQYLEELLDRINAEINATGGYTYITEGQGIRTYDRAVTDPLVGAEATQVTEMKGGTLRFANTKTNGNWNWKTVITSGHILAELVTAAQITAGYIGSAASGNYWNLDTGYLTVGNGQINAGTIKGGTLSLGGANNVNGLLKVYNASGSVVCQLDKDGISATGQLVLVTDGYDSGAKHYAKMGSFTFYNEYGTQKVGRGLVLYSTGEYANSQIAISSYEPGVGITGQYATAIIAAPRKLVVVGGTSTTTHGAVSLDDEAIMEAYDNNGNMMQVWMEPTRVTCKATRDSVFAPNWLTVRSSSGGNYTTVSFVVDAATVSGTKSRLVDTDDYGKRLLYSYETPAPLFGDVGSGVVGNDGLCFVEIDDIFTETSRVDIGYQVFLQKCGSGDIWVAEKASAYFVVEGTPGLAFDWEIKAHQTGYEHIRNEEFELMQDMADEAWLDPPHYQDYVTEMEELYQEEIAA